MRDMADLQLTMEDINELFRTMPEAARQAQLIAQGRMIRELETELTGLRSNGHKEASDAEGGEEALPVHDKGKAAGKVGS